MSEAPFPFPSQPLSEQEKEQLADLLQPEIARLLLEQAKLMKNAQMTTALDWRLHFWKGDLTRGTLTETKATTYRIR